MATKIGCHRTTPRKPMNRVSKKQRQLLYQWHEVTMARIVYLSHKYGKAICEYCGKPGYLTTESPYQLHGHHIDKNRKNNTPENCYIVHDSCHTYIHDHNLVVTQEDFQGRINKL